jgi:hypothetical protein
VGTLCHYAAWNLTASGSPVNTPPFGEPGTHRPPERSNPPRGTGNTGRIRRDPVRQPGGAKAWPVNRSSRYRPPNDPPAEAVGHRQLRTLLSAHAALRGEGVIAADHRLSDAQLARAVDACRYFELDELAELLTVMPQAASSPRAAATFDAEYQRRYSTGDALVAAIRRKIDLCPEDFPVRSS